MKKRSTVNSSNNNRLHTIPRLNNNNIQKESDPFVSCLSTFPKHNNNPCIIGRWNNNNNNNNIGIEETDNDDVSFPTPTATTNFYNEIMNDILTSSQVLEIPRGGGSNSDKNNRRMRSFTKTASLEDTNKKNGIRKDDGRKKKKKKMSDGDGLNYALLIALYTLQGIPMGLSASIPFLIQQKLRSGGSVKAAYNAQAIFALCSWPFSLKLIWAPIVDALYIPRFGRRKTWLVPIQTMAGALMVAGSHYVQQQLGFSNDNNNSSSDSNNSSQVDVKGVTAFFFALYFLMATQDVAVDGWALTMLQKHNRGKGPVCNSIGQNLGYFLSFVGFLALNDPDSSENLWRPLLRLPSQPGTGLVSLGGFIRFMGFAMLLITTLVAFFKPEYDNTNNNEHSPPTITSSNPTTNINKEDDDEEEEEAELDAAQIGLRETYRRLWAAAKLPAVRWLFLLLLTYRFPTGLSDNVKYLKAVEYGMSKQTTALLSPLLILPLGIAVPILAHAFFEGQNPLSSQFMVAYKARVTIVPLLDVLMLYVIKNYAQSHRGLFWTTVIASTAMQAIVQSLQFNAQMIFFAHRVDPAIGGSYMTLLNTAANLGGTWPSSLLMYLLGQWTIPPSGCNNNNNNDNNPTIICTNPGRDAYFPMQLLLSALGCAWIFFLSNTVQHVAHLPDSAWRTHIDDDDNNDNDNDDNDVERNVKQTQERKSLLKRTSIPKDDDAKQKKKRTTKKKKDTTETSSKQSSMLWFQKKSSSSKVE